MLKLYYSAAIYLTLGLLSGLYYREFTKINDYDGPTQLAVVHTHLLTLGMMMFLIVLLLEKAFALSETKWFKLFFWHYHGGMLLTVGMMVVHGSRDVLGLPSGAAIAGIAGLGHILLTVAFVFLFIALKDRITATSTPAKSGGATAG